MTKQSKQLRQIYKKKSCINAYNYFIYKQIPMNSFLFEKNEVSCSCFGKSFNNLNGIFKPQSYQPSSNQNKDASYLMVKKLREKVNTQKKSLKKQKTHNYHFSTNNDSSKEELKGGTNFAEVRKDHGGQFKLGTSKFDQICTPKFQLLMEKRQEHFTMVRRKPRPIPATSQHIILTTPLMEFQHIPYPQHPFGYIQYEKRVQQEFRKDLCELQLQMDKKYIQSRQVSENRENSANMKSKLLNEVVFKINKINERTQQRKLQASQSKVLTQRQIQQLQKNVEKTTLYHQQRQPTARQRKATLQKMESLPQIYHQMSFPNHQLHIDIKEPSIRPERNESCRKSSISCRQKQPLCRKINDNMFVKEIESENDESSSDDSDKISVVLGRGWDGLTEQKHELEELDEMINQKKNNQTSTMVTQESNIKNSQIKTFTDYSNSFISPKSLSSKPTTTLPFGGGIDRYGATGMSYQHIEEMRKLKASLCLNGRI